MSARSNMPVPYPGPVAMGSEPVNGTILPSATYSHTANSGVTNSGELFNAGWRGVALICDTTNVNGTGTVVMKVQVKDLTSRNWIDLAGAATGSISTVTTTPLTIYPGLAESSNVDISDPLPLAWRVVITVATADVELSVSGTYLA